MLQFPTDAGDVATVAGVGVSAISAGWLLRELIVRTLNRFDAMATRLHKAEVAISELQRDVSNERRIAELLNASRDERHTREGRE